MKAPKNNDTDTRTQPEDSVATPLGRHAVLRQAAPVLVMGAGILVLGAVAQWVGDTWFAHVAAAMSASLLLGVLLVRKPVPGIVAACGAVTIAAFACGALLAGATPISALIQAAGVTAGGLIAHAVLRTKQIEAAGLHELAPFARTMAVSVVVLPLCYALASSIDLDWSTPNVLGVWRAWLAGAMGVVAALPLVLTWPNAFADQTRTDDLPADRRERLLLAALAWLPVPAMLWGRPDMLLLGLLPLVAVAARIGTRATAWLGLATGCAVAAFAASASANERTPDIVALPACAALIAALTIAILATQRDRTARTLVVAQDRLAAVTERGPTLVATLGPDLRHQFVNRGYLQWLGKDESQVMGHSLHEVYGDAAAGIAATIRHTFTGQPQRRQVQLPDGRELDIRFEPRFAADGPVDGVHLLAQDTGWRSAHERSMEAMLAGAFDPTVVLDHAGTMVRLNDKVEVLFGTSRTTLLGQPLAAWLEPPAAVPLAEALVVVREQQQPQKLVRGLDLQAKRADGSTFPVELLLAPMTEGGRSVQAVVAIHDLGPRLAWEQLMVSSRRQAEVTLDSIGDAVVACNLQHRITLFNPAAARMSGWPVDEAMGKPLDEVLRFIDPANGDVVSSLLREAIRSDAMVRQQSDRLLQRRDGENAAVAESAAPIRDRFGTVSGAVLSLHDVSQLHAQTQTLSHQAQHDHLTGLPNRVLLQDRLTQALAQQERGYKGALLYLDLDLFKTINDTLGHPVGDRVLQEVALRLRAGVREDDTVSRQGGDEFVLLLVRLADPRDAARVAEKLINAIEGPINIDGQDLTISASIGIALFPQDGHDTRTLTRQADAALYHAKQGGRGRYSYFTDIMSASAEERVRTEHDLRISLANGDFFLVWQPQVQLPQRHIDGVEALVRWRKLDGSVALPEEFIPVAEETGLVVQIDEWVLREACRQNVRWQQQGLASLPVSVNVSLARFDAERLLTHVDAVLLETCLEPRWLEIEFKGAQLFAQGVRGQALVAALKARGVRVAADDFGSGQASLGALTHFAFDTLKIDRDFVQNIVDDAQSRAVTKVMLGIGQAMGYRVIAKGVETDAQHEALVQLGCTGMQGLMFGQAAPAERFAWLVGQGAGKTGAESLVDHHSELFGGRNAQSPNGTSFGA